MTTKTSKSTRVTTTGAAAGGNRRQQQTMILGVIVVVAVAAVLALVLLSGRSNVASDIDYAAIPQARLDDGGFVLGDPNAPITIVEFADYGCPHCQTYKQDMDRFIKEYVVPGKARFEFRTFATAGGALTQFAARVAECADELQPGAFWRAHEMFYELATSGQYSERMGNLVADRLGIPYGDILQCTRTADQVATDEALGRRVGITGTPAVAVRYGNGDAQFASIGGQTFNRGPLPYEAIQQLVDAAQS